MKIDKSVVDPNDVGMLEDLVTAAINAAATKVRETSKEKMAAVMGGMGGHAGDARDVLSDVARLDPIRRLVQELSRLPGIGEKTATRLAFHLVRGNRQQVLDLAQALVDVTDKIRLCSVCMNMTEQDPCVCAATRAASRTRSAWSRRRRTYRDRSRRALPRPLPRAARPALAARGHRPG